MQNNAASLMTSDNRSVNIFDLNSLRTEVGRLKSLDPKSKDGLEVAARQFEALFFKQLLTSMRKVNRLFSKDGILSSQSQDFYQDLWDQQMAVQLSTSHTGGIAKLLVHEFSPPQRPGHNTVAAKNATPSSSRFDAVMSAPSRFTGSGKSMLGLPNVALPVQPQRTSTSPREPAVTKQIRPVLKPVVTTAESVSEPKRFTSPREFVAFLLPLAKKAATVLGTSPQLLLAQAALETGWGRYLLPTAEGGVSRNLFNIKAGADWRGAVAVKTTLEYDGHRFKAQKGIFRVYDSFKQSFDDFVALLSDSQRYQSVVASGKDTDKYLHALQNSGFATDPRYQDKIRSILKSDALASVSE